MVEKDDSIYAPSHDYDGFDARDNNGESRGPMLLVVAIAVLLAFTAVVYTAYHQGLRKGGRDAAPHVAAETGPIKTRPTETRGTPTPNLGNRAYEPLDNVKAVPVEEVQTAPLPEEPLKRPTNAQTEPAPKPKPKPVTVKPKTVSAQSAPASKPALRSVAKKTVAAKPAVTNGVYLVQIASFRSEEQALSAWSGLAGRLPGATSQLSADVQRADLGARGVYYRLRAASFADRDGATTFCNQIKKSGRDCLVVRR